MRSVAKLERENCVAFVLNPAFTCICWLTGAAITCPLGPYQVYTAPVSAQVLGVAGPMVTVQLLGYTGLGDGPALKLVTSISSILPNSNHHCTVDNCFGYIHTIS